MFKFRDLIILNLMMNQFHHYNIIFIFLNNYIYFPKFLNLILIQNII